MQSLYKRIKTTFSPSFRKTKLYYIENLILSELEEELNISKISENKLIKKIDFFSQKKPQLH